jgi:hypothetical protein
LAAKKVGALPYDLVASTTSRLPLVFTSSDPTVASVSGKRVTILKDGITTITASQAGNETWNTSSISRTLSISKTAQVITFAPLVARKVGALPYDLVASTTSRLPLVFTSSDPTVASISGKRVTILKDGITTITASQAGNETWNASSISRALTVRK